jgi:hypothetical protein
LDVDSGYDLVEVYGRLKKAQPPVGLRRRAKRVIKRLEDDAIRAPAIEFIDGYVLMFFQHASGWLRLCVTDDCFCLYDGKPGDEFHYKSHCTTQFRPVRNAVRRFSTRVINYERHQLWKRWEENGEKRPRMMQHAGTAGRKSRRSSGGSSRGAARETAPLCLHAPTASNLSEEFTGGKRGPVSGES